MTGLTVSPDCCVIANGRQELTLTGHSRHPHTMQKLVIVGARAHSREIHEAVLASKGWDFLGFVADGKSHESLIAERGSEILGDLAVFGQFDPANVRYVIGIGSPADRKRIDDALTEKGFEPATVIHPSATIGSLVNIAPGCYIAMSATITTQVSIGRHAHINSGAVISHDCTVGDYAIVQPNVSFSGGVTVGTGAYVGIGSAVRNDLHIGEWSVVGLGAAVVKDVAPHTTVVGVPARPIK